MPSSVIVGFVTNTAFDGSWTENPYFFQHFNLNSINLVINGASLPSEPLQPDFATIPGLVAREYMHMFENTGCLGGRRGNLVSYSSFVSGSTLFPFDLSWDQCNSRHIHAGRDGHIDLKVSWSQNLPHAICILVYMSWTEELERGLDENGFTVLQH